MVLRSKEATSPADAKSRWHVPDWTSVVLWAAAGVTIAWIGALPAAGEGRPIWDLVGADEVSDGVTIRGSVGGQGLAESCLAASSSLYCQSSGLVHV